MSRKRTVVVVGSAALTVAVILTVWLTTLPHSPMAMQDIVARATSPLYISHRGGLTRYPENSMEGFRASIKSGYPADMDVRALPDDTLVCVHDPVTQQTDLVLFSIALDQLGGRGIIAAELKEAEHVSAFVAALKDRNLEGSTIAQTYDWYVAQSFVAANLHTMYLGATRDDHSPAEISAAGIEFVGVQAAETTQERIAALTAVGLKVLVYTVNDRTAADKFIGYGAMGVFSDDVWSLAK
jgi:glycerophosphoryl diester phosphodiesterase